MEEALTSLYEANIQVIFDIANMRSELRFKYLSRPRHNRYLLAVGNDHNRAQRLYNANIRLAQATHPILTQFEVVLRNSLNIQLTSHFADPDWIINQKNGFMRDYSLRRSHYFLRNSIQKSEDGLNRKHIPISSGKIIADQTFGFWIALFLSHHYALIAGQPLRIFPHKPPSEDRAKIYTKLDDIRNFRNRVNHCEPLCFVGNTIDCTETQQIRTKLYDLLSWIEPELVLFFQSIDNIPGKLTNIMKI